MESPHGGGLSSCVVLTARAAQCLGQTLLHERHERQKSSEAMQAEVRNLQLQQFLTRKKLDQNMKEKEEREQAIRKKEVAAAETAAEMRELEAVIERLRREAVGRERELSDRDKRIVAMHASTQRLESTKQLLELRVRELEEVGRTPP